MEEQLKRIADALENIAQELGSVNVHLGSLQELECLSELDKCIVYVPPMPHQKEGYHILRIGGQVASY